MQRLVIALFIVFVSVAAAATTTCPCPLTALKAASNITQCTEFEKVLSCLTHQTSCDTVSVVTEATNITATRSCNFTETCNCEKKYSLINRTTTATRCSAARALDGCLRTITKQLDPACDSKTSKQTIKKTVVDTEIDSQCSGATSLYVILHEFVLCLVVIGLFQ